MQFGLNLFSWPLWRQGVLASAMVSWAREVTAKRSCKYGIYGSFEQLLFALLSFQLRLLLPFLSSTSLLPANSYVCFVNNLSQSCTSVQQYVRASSSQGLVHYVTTSMGWSEKKATYTKISWKLPNPAGLGGKTEEDEEEEVWCVDFSYPCPCACGDVCILVIMLDNLLYLLL